MAIDTKLALVNAAADTYLTALADYMDDLTVGHQMHFCPIMNFSTNGVAAADADEEDGGGTGIGTSITTDAKRQVRFNVMVKKTSDIAAAKYIIANRPMAELLGAFPLVWKIWSDGLQANSVTSPGDTAGF
jgi:hypothetical protein